METSLNKIRRLQQKGDFESAKAALEDLLPEAISRHPSFEALYGVVLFQSKELEKAKETIRASALETPQTSAWASDLGFGLFLMGDAKKAR